MKSLAGKIEEMISNIDLSKSILRQNRVHKLDMGELGIFDTSLGAWLTKQDPMGGISREYSKKSIHRIIVDTCPIATKATLKGNNFDELANCFEKAKQSLWKQEALVLAKFIYGATVFVPEVVVEQTQRLFEDLGRPVTVAAEENKTAGSLEDWSKKLVTVVRTDLQCETLFDTPRNQYMISLWEDIGWWVPAHEWPEGYENRKDWKNGSVQYSGF